MKRYKLKLKITPFLCVMSNSMLVECNLHCKDCLVPYEMRTHLKSSLPPETRVVNIDNEEYDVLIDRTTKWGNKFKVKEFGRKKAISLYKDWILNNRELMNCLSELKGKRLGCHCKPDICHGDVLVELVKSLGNGH